jgi:hypothetical protein
VDIFIAWSGEVGHQAALALKGWLPKVLQYVRPFVASEDVHKGQRWFLAVGAELEKSRFGIICLTRESLNSSWIHFEAGALSKAIEEPTTRVAPFLVGVSISDLRPPLDQFQATDSKKDDVEKLIRSINSAAAEQEMLDAGRLKETVDKWWPELDEKLVALATIAASTTTAEREEDDPAIRLLEQVLELLKSLHTKVNNLHGPRPTTLRRRMELYAGRPDPGPSEAAAALARAAAGDSELERITRELAILRVASETQRPQPPREGTTPSQAAPGSPKE